MLAMSCLALALQPANGKDILLQSRPWFPTARAAKASLTFRLARAVYSGRTPTNESLDTYGVGIGDDALAASSGQVVLGNEEKFRVVYRLVNSVYVLGIASADEDINVFECAGTVNQAVSVLVAACKGIDVTADKITKKYTEVYMALDIVLQGVSGARLNTILSSIHGEGAFQAVVTATDAENKARGAGQWSEEKWRSLERIATIEALSAAVFELPEETLAAGDEVAAALGPPLHAPKEATGAQPSKEQAKPVSEDPFEASKALTDPLNLAGSFQKSAEASADPATALAGLDITVAPAPKSATEPTYVAVEGFEGDYGGVDFEAENDALSGFGGAFEGLDGAFGGGLDISEYDGVLDGPLDKGLAGLEELQGGGSKKPDGVADILKSPTQPPASGAGGVEPIKADLPPPKEVMVVTLTEEFFALYDGLALTRIGLQGTLNIKTPSLAHSEEDAEFSFHLEGAAGIKKVVVRQAYASSLGQGLYHVRVPPMGDPVTVLKYRLEPRFTPVPLRVRLVTTNDHTSITFMIQYIANPYLAGVLKDVAFMASLPSSPTFVKMSPHGYLNRKDKQIKWVVPEITASSQGRLRAQVPKDLVSEPYKLQNLDLSDLQGEMDKVEEPDALPKILVTVEFSCDGQTLSGIVVSPAGQPIDFQVKHNYKVGKLEVLE